MNICYIFYNLYYKCAFHHYNSPDFSFTFDISYKTIVKVEVKIIYIAELQASTQSVSVAYSVPLCPSAVLSALFNLSSPEVGNGLSWPKPQSTCNAMVSHAMP